MPRKKYDLNEEVRQLVVTEEVALRLGMPFDTLEQLYENTKGFSGMEPDTKVEDKEYLAAAVRTAMSHYTEKPGHPGRQAAVVFLVLVCRNYETRRVFKNPMTLDDIRYGLEQNTRAALEQAFRDASGIS